MYIDDNNNYIYLPEKVKIPRTAWVLVILLPKPYYVLYIIKICLINKK